MVSVSCACTLLCIWYHHISIVVVVVVYNLYNNSCVLFNVTTVQHIHSFLVRSPTKPDPNIPETGAQLARSNHGADNCCYRYCSTNPADGVCAVCDRPAHEDRTADDEDAAANDDMDAATTTVAPVTPSAAADRLAAVDWWRLHNADDTQEPAAVCPAIEPAAQGPRCQTPFQVSMAAAAEAAARSAASASTGGGGGGALRRMRRLRPLGSHAWLLSSCWRSMAPIGAPTSKWAPTSWALWCGVWRLLVAVLCCGALERLLVGVLRCMEFGRRRDVRGEEWPTTWVVVAKVDGGDADATTVSVCRCAAALALGVLWSSVSS